MKPQWSSADACQHRGYSVVSLMFCCCNRYRLSVWLQSSGSHVFAPQRREKWKAADETEILFFVWVWVFNSHFCPFSVQRKPAKASLCNKGQRSDWDQRQRPWDFKVKEADVIGRRAGSERWSAMCHLLVDWTPTAACVMREKKRQQSRRHEMALRLFPLRVETSEAAAVCNILTPCWKHTLSLLPWLFSFFFFRFYGVFFWLLLFNLPLQNPSRGCFVVIVSRQNSSCLAAKKKERSKSLKELHFPLALKHIYRWGVFINLIGNKVPNVITQNKFFSFHWIRIRLWWNVSVAQKRVKKKMCRTFFLFFI